MTLLLKMSLSGAVIILVAVVIRALAMNRLPQKTFLALWGIALIRLLIPFTLPSSFSAYNLIKNTPTAPMQTGTLTPMIQSPIEIEQVQAAAVTTTDSIPIIPFLWIAGMAVCAIYFIVTYIRCKREFRMSFPVQNEFCNSWLSAHKLKRSITIRQSSRITSPLTYGIFHPIILIPQNTDWQNTDRMNYILTHEYVHIKRFDAASKLFLTTALCIHWFNPLVWFMYILSNRDMELSCDETVVRSFGDTSKSAYARTLISMEEKKNSLTPLCNNFSKNAIEERITVIMKIKKTSFITVFTAFCLIIGVTAAFTTSAVAAENPANPLRRVTDASEQSYDAERGLPGTMEEYEQMLTLKTSTYKNQSVADFNHSLLTWVEKNFEVKERIARDVALNDIRVSLTEEELSFITLTIPLSNAKNAAEVTSENTGEPEVTPVMQYTLSKGDQASGYWYKLWYQLSVQVSDGNTLTIGERDQSFYNVVKGMQAYWNEKSLDEIAATNEQELYTYLNTLVMQNSNSAITFEVIQFSFEGMDERSNNADNVQLQNANLSLNQPIQISDKEIAPTGKISLGSQSFSDVTECTAYLTWTGKGSVTVLCALTNGATKSFQVENGKAITFLIETAGEYTISVKNETAQTINNVNGFIEFMQNPQSQNQDTSASLNATAVQTVTYKNVEMRRYEGTDGHPYIHDTKANETTKDIVGYEYGMLAFDKDGNPLKIDWWSLDTDSESTYFYLVETSTKIPSAETYDVRGGWSLNFNGSDSSVEEIAYVLYCDKKITFADGEVWVNPNFGSWRSSYEGQKVDVTILQNYYPYEQKITFTK